MAGCFEYYADLAEKLDDSQDIPVALPMEEFKTVLRREPLGPVGLISAWNYPMLIATVREHSPFLACEGTEPADAQAPHHFCFACAVEGGSCIGSGLYCGAQALRDGIADVSGDGSHCT